MIRQCYHHANSGSAPIPALLSLLLLPLLAIPTLSFANSPTITPDDAARIVVNRVERDGQMLHLRHPLHEVTFSADGIRFRPQGSRHDWRWRLSHVGVGDRALDGVEMGPVNPTQAELLQVEFPRGALTERYVLRERNIEQQFLIPRPLDLDGEDLVIAGEVNSSGRLRREGDQWVWRQATGLVTLGDVTVLDAHGQKLKASMSVTTDATRIVVDGDALASAAYPVLVDPIVGGDPIRITEDDDFGPPSINPGYADPGVAYDSANGVYFVCWSGIVPDAMIPDPRDWVDQVVCETVNGTTGAANGDQVVVSDMNAQRGRYPEVAVGNTSQGVRYVVVWDGVRDEGEGRQAFYRMLNPDMSFVNNQRVVNQGSITPDRIAGRPSIAFDENVGEFVVVFESDFDPSNPLADGDVEIFAMRIRAGGGARARFRVSDMSGTARTAAIAYDSVNGRSLVTWHGLDAASSPAGINQIWGRFLNGSRPVSGTTQFPISGMAMDAYSSDLDFDPGNGAFLVSWVGLDNTTDWYEIYAQAVTSDPAAPTLQLTDDLRVSFMGPDDGSTDFDVTFPSVRYLASASQMLVAWGGDDDSATPATPTKVQGRLEIWARALDATFGYQPIDDQFRVSFLPSQDIQSDGDDAARPHIAYNSDQAEALIVFLGRVRLPPDNPFPDFDVYARRFTPDPGFARNFDVDGNGAYEDATDRAIIDNYVNGILDATTQPERAELPDLLGGPGFPLIGVGATRTAEQIKAFMDAMADSGGWDVNANGGFTSLNDLFPLLVYLDNDNGNDRDNSAYMIPDGGARTSVEMLNHLDCLGASTPGFDVGTPSPSCPVPPLP